jgi:hypothetical protein
MEFKLIAAVLTAVIIASAAAHDHKEHHKEHNDHKATAYSGHHHKHGHGSHESDVTDQFIQNKVKTIFTQQNTTELIQFLSAMNTTEGQRAVKHLGVDATVVPKLLQLLQGSPTDVAKAKAQIQMLMQSIGDMKKHRKEVREVFTVYQVYLVRAEAQKQLQQANLDALKTALTALVAAESRRTFENVKFSELLQTLKTKGEQGRKEVIDKLIKWIAVASVGDLKRASKSVYGSFTKPKDVTTVPPAGNMTTSRPPGNFTTMRPAGNFTTMRPAGNATTTHPAGNATTTHPAGNSTTTHPAGNATTTHPAGNFTTPYPAGKNATTTSRPESTTAHVNQTTTHSPTTEHATTEHATPPRPEPMQNKKKNKKAE